jgi:16S rRNA C967 or C1407 C5-methylase (RsmB/RsmF family)
MIDPPTDHAILGHLAHLITPEGWLKVWPHQHQMDGFFMVRLRSHL